LFEEFRDTGLGTDRVCNWYIWNWCKRRGAAHDIIFLHNKIYNLAEFDSAAISLPGRMIFTESRLRIGAGMFGLLIMRFTEVNGDFLFRLRRLRKFSLDEMYFIQMEREEQTSKYPATILFRRMFIMISLRL
jgi:hypothetical protein